MCENVRFDQKTLVLRSQCRKRRVFAAWNRSRICASAIDYLEDSWAPSSSRLLNQRGCSISSYPPQNGSIMCILVARCDAHLDRNPLQTSHFAATKGLTAQTLAPDDAQGRSRQVKAGRGQVASQGKSRQVKAGQVRSGQVKAGHVKAGQDKSS